jgi:hypothetical protein
MQTHPKQPSDLINEQMRDYATHSRTKHENCEPPRIRLNTYKRRLISSIEPNRDKPPIPEKKQKTFTKPQSAKPPVTTFFELPAALASTNKESTENLGMPEGEQLEIQ